MTSWTDLDSAVQQPWTGIYLRVLTVVLLFGAMVHVGNMLGLNGTPWGETPPLWRIMDVVLLAFNLVVGVGLWQRQPWAVTALVVGVALLQVVPYTLFREQFVRGPEDASALNGLLGTWAVLLGLLALLLMARR